VRGGVRISSRFLAPLPDSARSRIASKITILNKHRLRAKFSARYAGCVFSEEDGYLKPKKSVSSADKTQINRRSKKMKIRYITLITVLLILAFALPLSAQKTFSGTISSLAEDTSIFPHDFNDEYYAENGVSAPSIIDRRSGMDYLSVFGWSSNPTHNDVRILITLPAYNENGEIRFWTPLGELNDKDFTDDGTGVEAREMAALYPLYVFPKSSDRALPASFTNTRQAALMDETQSGAYYKGNRLGLRVIALVNFTDKAFTTKEGFFMLQMLEKKNGLSLDGTPIIKFKSEILELYKMELITVVKRSLWEPPTAKGTYAISPVINIYENKGVIAPDAFLLMATRSGGEPLADERIFVEAFSCLKKFGTPCESNQ
jgi:hypothetical protein